MKLYIKPTKNSKGELIDSKNVDMDDFKDVAIYISCEIHSYSTYRDIIIYVNDDSYRYKFYIDGGLVTSGFDRDEGYTYILRKFLKKHIDGILNLDIYTLDMIVDRVYDTHDLYETMHDEVDEYIKRKIDGQNTKPISNF